MKEESPFSTTKVWHQLSFNWFKTAIFHVFRSQNIKNLKTQSACIDFVQVSLKSISTLGTPCLLFFFFPFTCQVTNFLHTKLFADAWSYKRIETKMKRVHEVSCNNHRVDIKLCQEVVEFSSDNSFFEFFMCFLNLIISTSLAQCYHFE